MPDKELSVWLGPARKPVKFFMFVSIVVVLALAGWLIAGRWFFGSEIGLKQFLSPADNLIVLVTMISGALAILSAGLYLSDTKGAIEPQPEGFFDVFSLIWSRISMIAITILVLVMFYEVVSRYVFVSPTLWANELSLWIAGFIFLLAGLYAMQQRSHIRIYIIYDMFPRWAQKTADVVSVALLWAFTFTLIWGGFNESRDKFFRWETFGTAWDPPIPATVKPAILIIIFLVAIQALSNLIADWHKAPEHHTPMDEIDESEIENIRQSIKD